MTYRQDFTLPAELMEQVQEQGLEILPELIRIVTPHLRWVQVSTLRCKPNAASIYKPHLTNII
jgi:hypothetical protein